MIQLQIWLATLLERAIPALVELVIGILAIRLILKLMKTALERSKLEAGGHGLILSISRILLYLLLGLMVASGLNIDVTGVVALASVLTLALSLSLQDMLTNVIGGFTLLYTHPFHAGDFVQIDDQSGTVREITMTYTKLTTADQKWISIPNRAVVAAQIVNFSASPTRRLSVEVAVAGEVPVQTVVDALLQAGTRDKVLIDPAPSAVVTGYSDRGVEYSLRLWVNTPDYWEVYHEVTRQVKEVFDARSIPMACPQRRVLMK